MSLTFSAAYTAQLIDSSFQEAWLLQLYYGDESSFIGLSSSDVTVSTVQYYGVVQDFGTLVQRIYIEESRAETDSITIRCANKWKTTTLSEELYGGSNVYLNRKVKIYSKVGGQTALLFEGKLVRISHTVEDVTLEIEQNRPWDDVVIPYTKGALGVYAPVAYGDFVQDTEANFYSSKRVYPSPFYKHENKKIFTVCHDDLASGAELYFYDKTLDKFIALTDVDSASTTLGSIEITSTDHDLARTFRFRPVGAGTGNDFSTNVNAYDADSDGSSDETTSAFSESHTVVADGDTVTEDYDCNFQLPDPDGKFSALAVHIVADVFGDYDDMVYNGGNSNLTFKLNSFDLTTAFIIVYLSEVQAEGSDYTEDQSGANNENISVLTGYQNNNYQMEDLSLRATYTAENYSGTNEQYVGWVKLYDVYMKGTAALDFANEAEAANKVIQSLEYLYLGADGFDKDYTGGSGVASEIHEIHRDLMDRFSGVDYDDDYMQGFDTDNTYLDLNLNSERSGWTCHWWQLEPRPLSEILEQAQFEGCFTFFLVPDSDGSGNPGGKYVWVLDIYDSDDVSATLDQLDYVDLNVSMSDFKDLVTKASYNYDRHPARDFRMLQTTLESSTERTAETGWWAATPNANENHKQFDLEFLTADVVYNSLSHSSPSDCVALYYENIWANPRIYLDFTLTNHAYFYLDRGDIIQLSDTNVNPYGKTWSDLYFMVTEVERSPGMVGIVAREVYEA